jgi:hypothetical protein
MTKSPHGSTSGHRPAKLGREDNKETVEHTHEIVAALCRILNEYKSNSKENSGKERVKGLRETIAIIIAICLAVISIFQWKAAHEANSISYSTMIATTRPWIVGEFNVISLSKSEQGVNIGMEIKLKNIGHSPAQHVSVSPKIIPARFEFGIKTQREVCADSLKSWDRIKSIDNVIFPDSSQLTNNFGVVSMDEIIASQNFTIAKKMMNNHPPTEAELADNKKFSPFFVVGCISYDFDGSPDVHQTGFVLSLTDIPERPGGVVGSTLIDVSQNREIPVSNLYLVQNLFGSFAN